MVGQFLRSGVRAVPAGVELSKALLTNQGLGGTLGFLSGFRGIATGSKGVVARFLDSACAGDEVKDDPGSAPVELYGPGDLRGIDFRHVIRTEPRDRTVNYEPNYFAGIEFDHPEFPWLFTPAAPSNSLA